jgi:alpha-maltose-1-phosphate synthase
LRIMLIQFESTGGVQLYTAELANELAKTNEVHFLLGKRLMNQRYYNPMIHFHYVSSPLSYAKMLLLSLNPLTYLNIGKIIRQVNPDVIHIASPFLWIALVLLFLKKYPIVVTEHDPALHAGTSMIVKMYMSPSIWLIRKVTDAIIVHGRKLKQVVVDAGVQENKVWIIPHGEFSFYRSWMNRDIKEGKYILYFGSIREYKGLQYLLEAAPLIISQVPDAKVVIAGEGDLSKYISIRTGQEYFEIHNKFIPDEEVAGLFQKSAVVVLPYIGGSQSGVVPVAYSFGKPVVVTDIGSIAESVDEGETGFIVPPGDSGALAQAIVKLLKDDDLRQKMGENAFRKSQKELSWGAIAHRTMDIYNAAVAGHQFKIRKKGETNRPSEISKTGW